MSILSDLQHQFPAFPRAFTWALHGGSGKEIIDQLEAILLLPKEALKLHVEATAWSADAATSSSPICLISLMGHPRDHPSWIFYFQKWLSEAADLSHLQELYMLYSRVTFGTGTSKDLANELVQTYRATIHDIAAAHPRPRPADHLFFNLTFKVKVVSAYLNKLDQNSFPSDIANLIASFRGDEE